MQLNFFFKTVKIIFQIFAIITADHHWLSFLMFIIMDIFLENHNFVQFPICSVVCTLVLYSHYFHLFFIFFFHFIPF